MDSRDYAANYGSLSTGDAESPVSLSGIGQCRKILEWSSNFNPMQFKYVFVQSAVETDSYFSSSVTSITLCLVVILLSVCGFQSLSFVVNVKYVGS